MRGDRLGCRHRGLSNAAVQFQRSWCEPRQTERTGNGPRGCRRGGSAFDHPGLSGICLVQPVEDVVSELPRLSIPLLLVIGEADSTIPSAALVASATEADGRVEIIPHLDARLGRGLSDVGRAVARWLEAIGP